eukprot:17097-Heterococcus_DN1.PRE.3
MCRRKRTISSSLSVVRPLARPLALGGASLNLQHCFSVAAKASSLRAAALTQEQNSKKSWRVTPSRVLTSRHSSSSASASCAVQRPLRTAGVSGGVIALVALLQCCEGTVVQGCPAL